MKYIEIFFLFISTYQILTVVDAKSTTLPSNVPISITTNTSSTTITTLKKINIEDVLDNIDTCDNPVPFGRDGPWTSLFYSWDYWVVCQNYASRCQTSLDFVICESSKGWASPHMSIPFVSTIFFGPFWAWLIQGFFEIFEAILLTTFGDYLFAETTDVERETLAGSIIGDWVHAIPAVVAAWLLLRAYNFKPFLLDYIPTTRRYKIRDHETLDYMNNIGNNNNKINQHSDQNTLPSSIYTINDNFFKEKGEGKRQQNNNGFSVIKHFSSSSRGVGGGGGKNIIGFDEAIGVFDGKYVKGDNNHNIHNVQIITEVTRPENAYYWILRWKYILIWMIFGLLHIPVQYVHPSGCLETTPPTCTHTGLIVITVYIFPYFLLVYYLFMRTEVDEMLIWRGFPPKYRLQLFLWAYLFFFTVNLQNFGIWIRYFGPAGGFTQVWFVTFIWIVIFGIYDIYKHWKDTKFAANVRWVSVKTGFVDSYHWTISSDRYWTRAIYYGRDGCCCGSSRKEREKEKKYQSLSLPSPQNHHQYSLLSQKQPPPASSSYTMNRHNKEQTGGGRAYGNPFVIIE